MAGTELNGIGIDIENKSFEVSASSSQLDSWSLGCDITIEDMDADIQEIRVNDITMSGNITTEEISVDIESTEVKAMDLAVGFVFGSLGSSLGGNVVDGLDDIKDSIADINDAIQDISKESANIKVTINGIQSQVNDIGTEMTTKASVDSVIELGDQITEVQTNVAEQTIKVNSLGAEIATKASAESVTQIADELAITNESLAEQVIKVTDLTAEVSTKASSEMVTEISDNLKITNDTLAEQTLKVDALSSEISTKASAESVADIAGELAITNKSVAEQTIKVSALESEIATKASSESVLTLEGDVVAVEKAVAEQTIKVEGLEASIESKVSKEEFNEKTGELDTKYTNLKQTADNLTIEVGEQGKSLTKVVADVNGLSVRVDDIGEAQANYDNTLSELTDILSPEEMSAQIGKGVVLSTIIATRDTDGNITAGMNASSVHSDPVHGRVVFAGGVKNKTDWTKATGIIYEDGHIVMNSGEFGENVKIGNAMFRAVLEGDFDLFSYPENGTLVPLFQVNKDSSGKIVSISTPYDFTVNRNLVVFGDASSGDGGGGSSSVGIQGIKLNGTTYRDENSDGIIDLGTIGGGTLTEITYQMIVEALGYTPVSSASLGSLAYKNGLTASDVGALSASGGIIYSNDVAPLTLSSFSDQSRLEFYIADQPRAIVGWRAEHGAWLFNYNGGGNYIGVKDDGTPHYNGNTLIHSGNIGSYNAGSADVIAKTYGGSINYAYNDNKVRLVRETSVDWETNGYPNQYVGGLSAISNYCGWQMVTFGGASDNNPYFRKVNDNNTWSAWKTIAFTDSNVASATKLQTARTIWGQSFDGTGDIESPAKMQVLRFVNIDGSAGSYIGRGAGNHNGIFVYIPTADDFSIYTKGEQRMLINSSGNVTIGASDKAGASDKLYVDGHMVASWLYFKEADGTYSSYVGRGSSNSDIYLYSKATLKMYAGSSAAMIINSSGNVTIGASDLASVGYKLFVDGILGIGGSGNSQWVTRFVSNSEIGLDIQLGRNANNDKLPFSIAWRNDLETPPFTINPSGNVGIGTTEDTGSILSIYSNGYNGRVKIYSSGTEGLNIGQWDGVTNRIESYGRPLLITSYSNPIKFGLNGDGNAMIIHSSGNVLIGTTNDNGAKLQVKGNIDLDYYQLRFTGNSDNFQFGMGADNMFIYQNWYGHYFTTNGAERMRITSGGNVGIGTDNPSFKLHVNGTAKINDIVRLGANLYVSQDSTAYGLQLWGDADGGYLGVHAKGSFKSTNAKFGYDGSSQFYGAVTMSSTLSIGSYMTFNNGDIMYARDEGGTLRYIIGLTSVLSFGYESAYAGIDTHIYGNSIHLHHGTSRGTGLSLYSDGSSQLHGNTTINGNLVVTGDISA